MTARSTPGRVVVLAVPLALAGCGQFATPGEELWPYDFDYFGTEQLARAEPAVVVLYEDNEVRVVQEIGVGPTRVVIENLSEAEAVVVVYEDPAGAQAEIELPVGGRELLPEPPRRVLEVR